MDTQMERWLQVYEAVGRTNQHHLKLLEELFAQFDREGLEVLPLKGIDFLLRGIYGSLGRRPMSDIDLLVREEHLKGVLHLLEENGFQAQRHSNFLTESFSQETVDYLSTDRDCILDMVWNFWYRSEMKSIWERTLPYQTPCGLRKLLHPEDALHYLIAYQVAHRGNLSTLFVRDLQLFLEKEESKIDWQRWCAEARRLKFHVPLYHGLNYAVSRGLTALPEGVIQTLQPKSISEKWLLAFYQRFVTEGKQRWSSLPYLLPWIGSSGWKSKLRLLGRAFFPSSTLIGIRRGKIPSLGARLFAGIVRPFRIPFNGFWVLSRDALRALFSDPRK